MDLVSIKVYRNNVCIEELVTTKLYALHHYCISDLIFDYIIVDDDEKITFTNLFNEFKRVNEFCDKVYGTKYTNVSRIEECFLYNLGLYDMQQNPNKYHDVI